MTASPYHLTPRSLVGRRFSPEVFGGIRTALLGFCPPPAAFGAYEVTRVRDQHFIHVAPDSVRILSHGGHRFLSLAHVYGGPVASATVEELRYYGVRDVLAYGLAGGLGRPDLPLGSFYLVADAFSADGTTRHYSAEAVIAADADLGRLVSDRWASSSSRPPMRPVRAATGDAIYRENEPMLRGFREQGCDVVNLDSAHLYAAARANGERPLRAVQCGVVSDVIAANGRSESALAAMLASGAGDGPKPLEMTGDIVRFFVEELAPGL